MERLTEKIGNTNCVKGCGSNCKYGFQHCRTEDWENCKTIDDVIDRLAEYEDLEEQGRLISLPCKVEDTVYEITGATARGYDWKYLTYEKAYIHKTIFNLDRLNDIGKTVFLTKREAEAKLKELRGGE